LPTVRPVAAVAVLLAASLVGVSAARAEAIQGCDASAYAVAAQSLTGPGGADLAILVTTATAACELPQTLSHLRASILPFKKHAGRVVDFQDVPSPNGAASVHLGRVTRHQRLTATITFGAQIVLKARTRTLLRPDLVLRKLVVPKRALAERQFLVGITVGEPIPDLGAAATVEVSAAGAVVATAPIRIAPRRRALLSLPVTVPAAGLTLITAAVVDSNPGETTLANNTRSAKLDVTDFFVVPSQVIVPNFAGYGGQFNHHVYAALSRSVGVTDDNVGLMEQEMRALRPQFSRIFFHPSAFTDPDRMQSFVRTVLLMQSTGTTINITWQGGRLDTTSGTIQKFAEVLNDLVNNRGVTKLRWVTLQNEPNSTKLTPAQVETEYRQLDPYIQSIRGQVRFMGGDLVRTNQEVWFQYMATHMSDILDAWSIHVYWDYWDTQKLQDRLTEVRAIVDALPADEQKPLYVTEYGVRGLRTLNGVPQGDPGVWSDGTLISRTNVSAFQHAWFDILAARLGYVGTSKWDSYFGKYDNGTQAYYMIGSPQEGWPLFPLYNLIHLMTTTVRPTWKVVGVDQMPDTTKLIAACLSPKGEQTIIGLDTSGAQLNTVSSTQVTYAIGGLPPSRKLRLAIWNEAGDGLDGPTTTVLSDAAGVATIAVPLNGVFVLTSLRLA
jgi:Glycosyl hydrolase catalytic core